jgi:hypothetical protein
MGTSRHRGPRRSTWVALAVAVVVVASASAPGAASAARLSWDPFAHPSTSGRTQDLYAIAAAGRHDVWAVGRSWGEVGGALEFRTLAQHWDGNAWTTVSTPDVETAPARDNLSGVAAVAPDNVWAVGSSATSSSDFSSKPLVEHWDGSVWQILGMPPLPALSTLSSISVAPSGTIWMLGDQYNPESGYYKPLVLRRLITGQVDVLEFPAPAECTAADDGSFRRFEPGGIAVGGDGDPYVAGTCSSPTGDRAVLGRYDGHWQSAFDSTTLPSPSSLDDVAGAPGHPVIAVGGAGGGPLILRGTKLRFKPEDAPNLGDGIELHAAAVGRANFAVGTYSNGDAFARPAVMKRVRGAWRLEPVSSPYGNPMGVAVDPAGQGWAVGVSVTDDAGLILKRSRRTR